MGPNERSLMQGSLAAGHPEQPPVFYDDSQRIDNKKYKEMYEGFMKDVEPSEVANSAQSEPGAGLRDRICTTARFCNEMAAVRTKELVEVITEMTKELYQVRREVEMKQQEIQKVQMEKEWYSKEDDKKQELVDKFKKP